MIDRPVHLFVSICKELSGLSAIHLALLTATIALAGGDGDDLRFQVVYLMFVLPGWLLSPRWTGNHAGLAKQYVHALITSFLIHSWLVAGGIWLGLGLGAYFIGFGAVLAASLIDRGVSLGRGGKVRALRLDAEDLVIWLVVLLFVVIVYRAPRSNDIGQFLLQQQDAVETRMLRPSAIGMSGMGVDQPMPRWRANYWHLWPSLAGVASGLPVRAVLLRFASLPLSLAALVCLLHTLKSVCRRTMPMWAVVLAVFGPVVLWYRAYNAFTYSFRLTNSFCLDKDFCLFFLIPAIVYLAAGWLRGARQFVPLLALSIPAVLRFHPLTAVYLLLLLPFVVVGFQRPQRSILNAKSLALVVGAILLFLVVLQLGDAQSFHQQIHELLRIDFADSVAGRPLHYWIGHYGSIRELNVPLDTSAWTGDSFHLSLAIIFDCGLLLVAHAAWLIWGVQVWLEKRNLDRRRWIAVGIALAMPWAIIMLSPVLLGNYPYLLAGFERLHWFAYLPALVAVACGSKAVADFVEAMIHWPARDRGKRLVNQVAITLTCGLVLYSALALAMGYPTGLANIRGLNSLLDYELPAYQQRVDQSTEIAMDAKMDAIKPEYLRDNDRVLLLGSRASEHYWLFKQAVFWNDPYAEAFALHRRGADFLDDRSRFYALFDRIPDAKAIKSWLDQKQITLIVDRRDHSDDYFGQLNQSQKLGLRRIEPGVWRYEPWQ